MIIADVLKAAFFLILILFLAGFIFGVLLKIGVVLLVILGIVYLIKKIFLE